MAHTRNTHNKVSIDTAALCQRLADLMEEVVLSLARRAGNRGGRGLDRLLFKLDRHGAFNRMRPSLGVEWARAARCGSDRRVLLGEMGVVALVVDDGWGRQHASSAQSALALAQSGAGADTVTDHDDLGSGSMLLFFVLRYVP
jgi:hypothetical protein